MEYTFSTSSGMVISRCWETSCSSRPMGNSGMKASRGTGLPSAGLSMGGTGTGRDGWMLSHFLGISRVGSWKILSSVMRDSFRPGLGSAPTGR